MNSKEVANIRQHDKKLLEYYMGKSSEELAKAHEKYKSYAETLAGKCELVRAQIDYLYKDLKQAKALYTHALDTYKNILKEKRGLQKGDSDVPPWCLCADVNDDDLDTELELQENNKKLAQLNKTLDDYVEILGESLPRLHEVENKYDEIDTLYERLAVNYDKKAKQLKVWTHMKGRQHAEQHYLDFLQRKRKCYKDLVATLKKVVLWLSTDDNPDVRVEIVDSLQELITSGPVWDDVVGKEVKDVWEEVIR